MITDYAKVGKNVTGNFMLEMGLISIDWDQGFEKSDKGFVLRNTMKHCFKYKSISLASTSFKYDQISFPVLAIIGLSN